MTLDYFSLFSTVLWSVFGECENFEVMSGHSGAVMDLHFNTDGRLVVHCLHCYDFDVSYLILRDDCIFTLRGYVII